MSKHISKNNSVAKDCLRKKLDRQFTLTVLTHWEKQGRHDLLWRQTTDPYLILISEIMLQQTQVDRVIPKYKVFIKRFPTVKKLSGAPLAEVLAHWQGLGYNRRAKFLHQCAKVVMSNYEGTFPSDYDALKSLPGIGPYTAGAIMAFAFDKPEPIIETNIRSVYLHHYFKNQTDVTEKEILEVVKRTVPDTHVREWYWALMDYGTYLKKEFGNQNSRSKNYVRQSRFKGSDREVRGAIIKEAVRAPFTRTSIHVSLQTFDPVKIDVQLEKLIAENMLTLKRGRYALPS